jgi:hypothetical protein
VLAVVAASAADVKGNGHDIADLDIFDVGADLDHLAGHFVAHRHPLGDFKRTSVDVKVAAADVRGDDLENGAVGSFLPCGVISSGNLKVLTFISIGFSKVTIRLPVAIRYLLRFFTPPKY